MNAPVETCPGGWCLEVWTLGVTALAVIHRVGWWLEATALAGKHLGGLWLGETALAA